LRLKIDGGCRDLFEITYKPTVFEEFVILGKRKPILPDQ
jgi:hypothetical protein